MNTLSNQCNYNDVSMDFASPRSPLRRPKRQALSSVCNVSQAMKTLIHAKECFIPILVYIIMYTYVTMFGITPRSLHCKSESGWPEPQAKLCQTGIEKRKEANSLD